MTRRILLGLLIFLVTVTLAAAWLAREWVAVEDRQSVIALVSGDGGLVVWEDAREPSAIRRLLGDREVLQFVVTEPFANLHAKLFTEVFPGTGVVTTTRHDLESMRERERTHQYERPFSGLRTY